MVAADAAGLDGDAGHRAHGVVQIHQVLVVQQLARHHGDRLRDLTQALHALAYRDGGRRIGTRAFGRGQVPARDRHRRQRRRIRAAIRGGRPHNEAGAAGHRDQPAAGQQPVQRGLRRQLAGHGGRLQTGDGAGAEQDLHLGLSAQANQRIGHAARGQLKGKRGGALRMGRTGRDGSARQGSHGQRAQ
ncbi:hypothetical protein D3C71_1287820 [compost metagenome]